MLRRIGAVLIVLSVLAFASVYPRFGGRSGWADAAQNPPLQDRAASTADASHLNKGLATLPFLSTARTRSVGGGWRVASGERIVASESGPG